MKNNTLVKKIGAQKIIVAAILLLTYINVVAFRQIHFSLFYYNTNIPQKKFLFPYFSAILMILHNLHGI